MSDAGSGLFSALKERVKRKEMPEDDGETRFLIAKARLTDGYVGHLSGKRWKGKEQCGVGGGEEGPRLLHDSDFNCSPPWKFGVASDCPYMTL